MALVVEAISQTRDSIPHAEATAQHLVAGKSRCAATAKNTPDDAAYAPQRAQIVAGKMSQSNRRQDLVFSYKKGKGGNLVY